MYIDKLQLENIRLLTDQEFLFRRPDGSTRMWTVLIGDNGVCKSTILQTIALAGVSWLCVIVHHNERFQFMKNICFSTEIDMIRLIVKRVIASV